MLYMMASAAWIASRTFGLTTGCISWPYGLIYQIREIRAGKGASADLENEIFGMRRSGREPGR